ncbi:MAG: GNAT family N-acetyltransferase [Anaerolineales bacterium]
MPRIRAAQPQDHDAIWAIFHKIVSKGETYAFDPNTSREEALRVWIEKPTATYVAELNGDIVGTYYIKPNQPKLGAHICNCGYMVAPEARGRGIATAMCEHSQIEARRLGFLAMQFNLVVSTNEDALHLWSKLGFELIGTLPKAFQHKRLGFVDAHIMYKWLK